jgi:hypothetical protein
MNALEEFHHHCSTVGVRRKKLEDNQEKLLRQLNYFQGEVERAQILNDERNEKKALQAISIIDEKLAENNKAFEELNITPYAERALQEIMSRRRTLEDSVEEKWQAALEARHIFIKKLEELGELHSQSINLAHESKPIALVLKQNPVREIGISGQHQLVVNLDLINDILRI